MPDAADSTKDSRPSKPAYKMVTVVIQTPLLLTIQSYQCKVMAANGQLLLRIVRRRPTCAQLTSLADPDGPVLDNPQGRKPRGLLIPISRYAVLWGFERRQK